MVKFKIAFIEIKLISLLQQEIMQSKYAGISPESVQCVVDQVMTEQLTPEACAALAEDVTYKLRQLIHVRV